MKPGTKKLLLLTVAILVVALVVLAALPCGVIVHGAHEVCPICFLHVAEAPPTVEVSWTPSLVQIEAMGGREECAELVADAPYDTRGPPGNAT